MLQWGSLHQTASARFGRKIRKLPQEKRARGESRCPGHIDHYEQEIKIKKKPTGGDVIKHNYPVPPIWVTPGVPQIRKISILDSDIL